MMATERTPPTRPTLPVVERGRDRLDNWALWSRLDGADTGFPRKCAFWTPPRAGDVWDESDDAETQPIINHQDAEAVEAIIVTMAHVSKRALRAKYIDRRRIDDIARLLSRGRDDVDKLLYEAEARIGRS